MAMLEAFLHDPLLNWRLTAPSDTPEDAEEVVDLETIGFTALKKLVIAAGVPKEEASQRPTKAALKELAISHGANLRFTDDGDSDAEHLDGPRRGLAADTDTPLTDRRTAVPTLTAEVDERVLNARAMHVLRRVQAKLDGTDAPPESPPMDFPGRAKSDDAFHDELVSAQAATAEQKDATMQVDRLINEAQSSVNLCQLYWGWNPFC